MCEPVVVGTRGVFSWTKGFQNNPKPKQLSCKHEAMCRAAQIDPEAVFDQLVEAGQVAEAAWLLAHLDDLAIA